MIRPTVEQLMQTLTRLGHKVFDDELNLVGIRKDYQATNRFDDTFCAFINDGTRWFAFYWPCTTDPGWPHLENGLAKGTAVLAEGQYIGAYKIGLHQGQYPALVQAGPVTVYRDRNGDHNLDLENPETGRFGINIHRAGGSRPSVQVDRWSAGCQVLANPLDFAELMTMCRMSVSAGHYSFTYTLIRESDLEG